MSHNVEARENARRRDGKFGETERSEADGLAPLDEMAANSAAQSYECNGICIKGYDILPGGGSGVAYPHPDCPAHGADYTEPKTLKDLGL